MLYLKFMRTFIGFIKCRKSVNLSLSGCLKKYSTRKIENTVHKIEIPGGRVSKVKKELDFTAYLLLVIPFSTFYLGCWQVKRKKWKEDLIERLLSKTRLPPVPLPTELSEIADLEFRKVNVTGEFDHSCEMYLGPRSCISDGTSTYSGKLVSSATNSSSGYYVITPFIRSDTKERILVNRGWIPFSQKNPKTRERGQVKGEIEITGVVRTSERASVFFPMNKEDVRLWFVRDVEKMADMIEGVPVYIDATVETSVPGGPVGGQTTTILRNEHLSYLITWYSLSAGTAWLWYAKYIK